MINANEMYDFEKMREDLLLDQLTLAEAMVKEKDPKKKQALGFDAMRCYFRIELIDELFPQFKAKNIN